MKNKERYTDREWEELASSLSGEKSDQQNDLLNEFLSGEEGNSGKQWKELRDMSDDRAINVDSAWKKVNARIGESNAPHQVTGGRLVFMRSTFVKIAAAALLLIGIGTLTIYLTNSGIFSKEITSIAGNDGKMRIELPDGSIVYLNRNTELSYRKNFGKQLRNVKLAGEAFFEIASDPEKPFIVDAGKAMVKVTGTSFNVITNNIDQTVEVFVNTGQVMLSDNSGKQSLILEPGYIGTMDSALLVKKLNANPNYLSWKTGLLIYDNQKLDVVFRDLKKVYNIDIRTDDPKIREEQFGTNGTLDNLPHETIIQLICTSFNLSYSKDGNVYHLAKK